MPNPKCVVCGTEKTIEGIPDFIKSGKVYTSHYECPRGCTHRLQCCAEEMYVALVEIALKAKGRHLEEFLVGKREDSVCAEILKIIQTVIAKVRKESED